MTRKYVNEKESKALFRKSKSVIPASDYESSKAKKEHDKKRRNKVKTTIYIEDSDEKCRLITTEKDKYKKLKDEKPPRPFSGGIRKLINRSYNNNVNNMQTKDACIVAKSPHSHHSSSRHMFYKNCILQKQPQNSPRLKSSHIDNQRRNTDSRRSHEIRTRNDNNKSNSKHNDQLLYSSTKPYVERYPPNLRDVNGHQMRHGDTPMTNENEGRNIQTSKENDSHRKTHCVSMRASSIGTFRVEDVPSGFFNSISESSQAISVAKKIDSPSSKSGDNRSDISHSRSVIIRNKNSKYQFKSPPMNCRRTNVRRRQPTQNSNPPSYNEHKTRKRQPVSKRVEQVDYSLSEAESCSSTSQNSSDWADNPPERPVTKQASRSQREVSKNSRIPVEYKGDLELYEIAEVKHQLHREKMRSDGILDDKRQLEKELGTVRKQCENIQTKYASLKMEYDKLILLDVDRQSLILTKQKLQSKIKKLYEIIEKNEIKDLEKDRKLIELEKERSKIIQEASTLKLERDHFSKQILENDNEEQKITQLKKQEHEKDIKIRIMHNELVELKGNIRVLARFKPEQESSFKFVGQDGVQLTDRHSDTTKKASKLYNFSHVFRPSANQVEVYQEVSPYVTSCIDGYNVCVITYGQTGSGKTYTMKGNQGNPGIISRAVSQVFYECNQRSVWRYRLYISILQIYNEHMTDLLTETVNRVNIQDDGNTVFIKGLREFRVKTQEDIVHYIVLGRQRRATTKTVLNFDSSRSHFIVMLRIHGTSSVHDQTTQGILTLCDLAGFERLSNKHPNDSVALEAKYISKSLTVLGRVFEALRRHHRSVPFRESKLTHLLKPSLSGEAKCVLILTLSTLLANIDSSLRTLDFGSNAMKTSLGVAKRNVGSGRKNGGGEISSAINALAAPTPSEGSDHDSR